MPTRNPLVESVLRALAPLAAFYIRPYAEFYTFGAIAGFEGDVHLFPADFPQSWPHATLSDVVILWHKSFFVEPDEDRYLFVVAAFEKGQDQLAIYLVEASGALSDEEADEFLGPERVSIVPTHAWLPYPWDLWGDTIIPFPPLVDGKAAPIALGFGPEPSHVFDAAEINRLIEDVSRLLAPFQAFVQPLPSPRRRIALQSRVG